MKNPNLANQLLSMLRVDLEFRQKLLERGELYNHAYHPEMEKIHLHNATIMQKILKENGWPTRDLVGDEAARAAWVILQHSISSPQLMKKGLTLLKQAAQKGEAGMADIARLEDRINYYEGREQIYGTNFDNDGNGDISPTPIADPEHVDERRAEAGLPPLKDDIKRLREVYRREMQGKKPTSPPADWRGEFLAWTYRVGWRKK